MAGAPPPPPTWSQLLPYLLFSTFMWLTLLVLSVARCELFRYFRSPAFRKIVRRAREHGSTRGPVLTFARTIRNLIVSLERRRLTEADTAIYFGYPRCVCGIIICVFYMINTYAQSVPFYFSVGQCVYGVFIAIKLLIRFLYTERPVAFTFKLTTIVDCLSLPTLIFCFSDRWLNFNFLQAYSVLIEWSLLEKHDYVLQNHSALMRLCYNLFIQLLCFLFITSCGVQFFELLGELPFQALRLETYQITWANSVYFAVVTFMTVGYGDFSPYTFLGRMWVVSHIIFAAVLLSRGISQLIEALQSMRRGSGSYVNTPGSKHVVVTGRIKWEFLRQFVIEFLEEPSNVGTRLIVLASNPDWTEDKWNQFVDHKPLFNHHLIYLEGSALQMDDLHRAHVDSARAVFVLADPHHEDPYKEDSDILKSVLTIRNYSGTVPVYTLNILNDSSFQFGIALEHLVPVHELVPAQNAFKAKLHSSAFLGTPAHKLQEFQTKQNPLLSSELGHMIGDEITNPEHHDSTELLRDNPSNNPNNDSNSNNNNDTNSNNRGGDNGDSADNGDETERPMTPFHSGDWFSTDLVRDGKRGNAQGRSNRNSSNRQSVSLCMQELETLLLSESIFCNGLSTFITNATLRVQPQPKTMDRPWLMEYKLGAECSVQQFEIRKEMDGRTVTDVATILLDFGLVLLAVRHVAEVDWNLASTEVVLRESMVAMCLSYHDQSVIDRIVDHAALFIAQSQRNQDRKQERELEQREQERERVGERVAQFSEPQMQSTQTPARSLTVQPTQTQTQAQQQQKSQLRQPQQRQSQQKPPQPQPQFSQPPPPQFQQQQERPQPQSTQESPPASFSQQPHPAQQKEEEAEQQQKEPQSQPHGRNNEKERDSTSSSLSAFFDSSAVLSRPIYQPVRGDGGDNFGSDRRGSGAAGSSSLRSAIKNTTGDMSRTSDADLLSSIGESLPPSSSHSSTTKSKLSRSRVSSGRTTRTQAQHQEDSSERDNLMSGDVGGPSSLTDTRSILTTNRSLLRQSASVTRGLTTARAGKEMGSGTGSSGGRSRRKTTQRIYSTVDRLPAALRGHVIICVDGETSLMNLDVLVRRIWQKRAGLKRRRAPIVVINPRFPKNYSRRLGGDQKGLFLLQGNSLSLATLKEAQYQSARAFLIMASETREDSAQSSTDSKAIFTVMALDTLLAGRNTFVCCVLDAEASLQLLRAPREGRRIGGIFTNKDGTGHMAPGEGLDPLQRGFMGGSRTASVNTLRTQSRLESMRSLSRYGSLATGGVGPSAGGSNNNGNNGSSGGGGGNRRRPSRSRSTRVGSRMSGLLARGLTRSGSLRTATDMLGGSGQRTSNNDDIDGMMLDQSNGDNEDDLDDDDDEYGVLTGLAGKRLRDTEAHTEKRIREERYERQRYASGEMIISSLFMSLLAREYKEPGYIRLIRQLIGATTGSRGSWIRHVVIPDSWTSVEKAIGGRTYRELSVKLLEFGCVALGLYRSGRAPVRQELTSDIWSRRVDEVVYLSDTEDERLQQFSGGGTQQQQMGGMRSNNGTFDVGLGLGGGGSGEGYGYGYGGYGYGYEYGYEYEAGSTDEYAQSHGGGGGGGTVYTNNAGRGGGATGNMMAGSRWLDSSTDQAGGAHEQMHSSHMTMNESVPLLSTSDAFDQMAYTCPSTQRRIFYQELENGENVLPYVYSCPEPYTAVVCTDLVFVLCNPRTVIPDEWDDDL